MRACVRTFQIHLCVIGVWAYVRACVFALCVIKLIGLKEG